LSPGEDKQGNGLELGISIKAVEEQRERLSAKLDLHDVAGLKRYAIARQASSRAAFR
jgi:hypothetical protein